MPHRLELATFLPGKAGSVIIADNPISPFGAVAPVKRENTGLMPKRRENTPKHFRTCLLLAIRIGLGVSLVSICNQLRNNNHEITCSQLDQGTTSSGRILFDRAADMCAVVLRNSPKLYRSGWVDT